jgi:hypothetical protein
MPFYPNSFTHERFGAQNTFTTRFANDWALSVTLPMPFTDSTSDPLRLIEVSVLSGQRLLELDRFGDCAVLVTCDMYAELMHAVKHLPQYNPNSDFGETEVADGINAIRKIVSPSPSFVL